jgi:hypothetical protein
MKFFKMREVFTKIIKFFAQRIFSFLWRICIPFELLKLKRRYRNYHIKYFQKGKGEMFKFILISPNRQKFFLKKDNKLTEYWGYLNSKFQIAKKKPNHLSFNDKANVLELILNTHDLKKYTLLKSIDREHKEYQQEFLDQCIDLSEEQYAIHKTRINEILECFHLNGITSYDHKNSNFIFQDNTLFIVDLESLQFISKLNV